MAATAVAVAWRRGCRCCCCRCRRRFVVVLFVLVRVLGADQPCRHVEVVDDRNAGLILEQL